MAGAGDSKTWAWFSGSKAAWVALWLVFVLPRAALMLLDVTPTSDADWYFTRAGLLAAGEGYRASSGALTAYWPVGWPMTIAALFKLFGPSISVVGLFNLACSALSGWLLYDLARRLSGREAAGRLALLLYAIYPNAMAYVPLALTEVFYTTLLLAICWLLAARERPHWLAAGLLLGLASLVKAQTLVVVPLILAIALLRAPGFWRRLPGALGRFALLVGLAAVVVSPWTLRNHRVLGHYVAVSTNGGITLFTGNNDSARGDFTPNDPAVKALEARGLGEVEKDAEAKRLGVAWIKAHPAGFLKLMPLKLFRLWGPDGEGEWAYQGGYRHYDAHQPLFRAVRYANQAYYFALLGLFALFAVVQLRRRFKAGERLVDWWLLPCGIAAYPTAVALVFSGQSRFHFPAMPFVVLAAAWLLAEWLDRRSRA